MANKVSDRLVKAFEKFNADLQAFGKESCSDTCVAVYEDANTSRFVSNFKLYKNGKLTWDEEDYDGNIRHESEQLMDDDEARDYLSFWRANLRRAKRYWEMDIETLDKIQDGEIEDKEDD